MRYLLLLLLAGCAQPTVIRDRPTRAAVPVIQPCASEKPAAVTPVNRRYSQEQWDALSHKQRSEIMAAQGLSRLNYSGSLEAATSAC